jgi:ubiquinone/menaquinone biosynthesis C-methylase UbiE
MKLYLYKTKQLLIRIKNGLQKKYVSLTNILTEAKSKSLIQNQFKLGNKIHSGKDGLIYMAYKKPSDSEYIVKILSPYAVQFLPITKIFLERMKGSRFIFDVEIIKDSFMAYEYTKLTPASTQPKYFFQTINQLCDLEIELLNHRMCYWDFGFDQHANYMLNNLNELKIIDYGGNGFLFLDETYTSLNIRGNNRENLIHANLLFLQTQLLLHILYQGLGRKTSLSLASVAQDAGIKELSKIKEYCLEEIKSGVYEKLALEVASADLLTHDGWKRIKDGIESGTILNAIYQTQERADIDSIEINHRSVKVRGYQSYTIDNDVLTPVGLHSNKLWDTQEKFNIVENALKTATAKNNIDSFLDIGSNLGLYVFTAHLNFGISKSEGCDYNSDYIEKCNQIRDSLGLDDCNFIQASFSEIDGTYDCVLAMAIIHHLFHRTEDFGSLDKILSRFANMTNKFLIIEFPNEHDEKASKWTSMQGRAKEESYSEENFLKAVNKYFTAYEVIGRIGKTRTTYLLTK